MDCCQTNSVVLVNSLAKSHSFSIGGAGPASCKSLWAEGFLKYSHKMHVLKRDGRDYMLELEFMFIDHGPDCSGVHLISTQDCLFLMDTQSALLVTVHQM